MTMTSLVGSVDVVTISDRPCSNPAGGGIVAVTDCRVAAGSSAHGVGMTTLIETRSGKSLTVDSLLAAIRSGRGIPADLYASDAVLDATVPNWRLTERGPDAIAERLGGWFAHPATMEELDRLPTEGGEVVRYLLTWTERSVPHAAHHVHLISLDDDGRIRKDVVFCGGRWDAALLAEIGEANR